MRGLESVRSDDLTFDDFGEIRGQEIMTKLKKQNPLSTARQIRFRYVFLSGLMLYSVGFFVLRAL